MGVDDSMGGNWGTDAQGRHFLISQHDVYTPEGKQHVMKEEKSLRDSIAACVLHGNYVGMLDELYALFDTVSGLRISQNKDGARYVLHEIEGITERVLPGFPTSSDEINPQRLFEMYVQGYKMQLVILLLH